MDQTLRPARALFAAVMIGLGITGLVNGDVALVWQQLPKGLPGYTALAYLCASIELLTGLGLLFKATLTLASRALFLFLLLWVLLLKLPAWFLAPGTIESWGGFGEIGIILTGSWCLYAMNPGPWDRQRLGFLVGEKGLLAARLLFIVCLPMIGIVHLLEGAAVASFVPDYLPFRLGWAYFTGSASFVAAAAILCGFWPRLAATLEALMLGFITVLCWAPLLSTGRTACTAFLISAAISGGAWLVAETYRDTAWLGRSKLLRSV